MFLGIIMLYHDNDLWHGCAMWPLCPEEDYNVGRHLDDSGQIQRHIVKPQVSSELSEWQLRRRPSLQKFL